MPARDARLHSVLVAGGGESAARWSLPSDRTRILADRTYRESERAIVVSAASICRRHLKTEEGAAPEIDVHLRREPGSSRAREEVGAERGGLGRDPSVEGVGGVVDLAGRAGDGISRNTVGSARWFRTTSTVATSRCGWTLWRGGPAAWWCCVPHSMPSSLEIGSACGPLKGRLPVRRVLAHGSGPAARRDSQVRTLARYNDADARGHRA